MAYEIHLPLAIDKQKYFMYNTTTAIYITYVHALLHQPISRVFSDNCCYYRAAVTDVVEVLHLQHYCADGDDDGDGDDV